MEYILNLQTFKTIFGDINQLHNEGKLQRSWLTTNGMVCIIDIPYFQEKLYQFYGLGEIGNDILKFKMGDVPMTFIFTIYKKELKSMY